MMQDSSTGQRNAPKVLVFANRIKTVRFLQQSLVEAGFKAVQLHGDRSQPEREVNLAVFIRQRKLYIALCQELHLALTLLQAELLLDYHSQQNQLALLNTGSCVIGVQPSSSTHMNSHNVTSSSNDTTTKDYKGVPRLCQYI